jgi:hypothetical protein
MQAVDVDASAPRRDRGNAAGAGGSAARDRAPLLVLDCANLTGHRLRL